MQIEDRRDLQLLEAVTADSSISQRTLASRLGIALGLTNLYLKRLVRKGYVRCAGVRPNRITYILTPRGIAEKARLTYEYMDYSLHLYADVRQHLRDMLQDCAAAGRRVAIFGCGGAAELAYLSLKEAGLEPVAIFEVKGGGSFLGMPIRAIQEHRQFEYDVFIIASLERPGPELMNLLAEAAVPGDKLFPLRREPPAAPRRAAHRSQAHAHHE